MLVINPDECIDCGVCETECPVEAIIADTKPEAADWVVMNREYARQWPNITKIGQVPADADEWAKVENKYPRHFSPEPAER